MFDRAGWKKVKDQEYHSPSGAYFVILEEGVGGALYTSSGEEKAESFNKDLEQAAGELLLEFNRLVVKDLRSLKRLQA